MSGDNVFARIIQEYNSLTKAEIKIADYVLKHKADLPNFFIADLAEACGVGEATITRFCRTVGCKSFNHFKMEAVQVNSATDSTGPATDYDMYEELQAADSIEQKCQKLYRVGTQALQQTLERLNPEAISEAVDLLSKAKTVYCFGQGNSSIVAMDAWGRFIAVSPKFHWVSDYHMQAFTAATLEPDDVILYFSFSGAMRELSELGCLIGQTGGKLILVTRFPNSPGAAHADLLLICGADESPRQQGSVAVKLGQLFIIDVLFQEYCARNPDLAQLNRERTLNATTPMLL